MKRPFCTPPLLPCFITALLLLPLSVRAVQKEDPLPLRFSAIYVGQKLLPQADSLKEVMKLEMAYRTIEKNEEGKEQEVYKPYMLNPNFTASYSTFPGPSPFILYKIINGKPFEVLRYPYNEESSKLFFFIGDGTSRSTPLAIKKAVPMDFSGFTGGKVLVVNTTPESVAIKANNIRKLIEPYEFETLAPKPEGPRNAVQTKLAVKKNNNWEVDEMIGFWLHPDTRITIVISQDPKTKKFGLPFFVGKIEEE